MTVLIPRRRWRAELSAATVPASLRPMKSTLLCLADLMAPTGELHGHTREELAASAGVPLRTLERHLQHAVGAGWLTHDTVGGNGRRAAYSTALPA